MRSQGYSRGETAHLKVSIHDEDTGRLANVVSVYVAKASCNGVAVTLPQTTFDHVDEGTYKLMIDTIELEPGTYDLKVVFDNGALGRRVIDDSFVVFDGGLDPSDFR